MRTKIFWLLLASLFALTMLGNGLVLADRDGSEEDDDDWDEQLFRNWFKSANKPNHNQYSQLYQEECGSCHFPYQPVFLPAASWRTMMGKLDEHFGENAELSAEDQATLSSYLISDAADRVNREIPNKVMWSLRSSPVPERITETGFFKHEHNEIPYSVRNKKSGEKLTFSNCDSCHKKALQGSYNEHEIIIPGIGRWDD
ncbi:MAG: diheme cytochrome c [Candidatus Thiodiazotropha sp. (ex Lucina aurantia)]|nr:diheme cytochrome c [Candidatus Thiodiazotropha taylori]MBV2099605.1 diheme cytochrome c [Candidatus Thiodiazotropha sp. (ex Codakia orbicularis)]MBV2104329.1 diheme cytochrome c [Candidatus Thiodiazotropha sp. (ex Lucina aurantia)]MBV2118742.1 diheme cytochrome c [Candidatus Thiodiazotropha sp. (ex Lucina aurantia)]